MLHSMLDSIGSMSPSNAIRDPQPSVAEAPRLQLGLQSQLLQLGCCGLLPIRGNVVARVGVDALKDELL
jgi:hypothetical protein